MLKASTSPRSRRGQTGARCGNRRPNPPACLSLGTGGQLIDTGYPLRKKTMNSSRMVFAMPLIERGISVLNENPMDSASPRRI